MDFFGMITERFLEVLIIGGSGVHVHWPPFGASTVNVEPLKARSASMPWLGSFSLNLVQLLLCSITLTFPLLSMQSSVSMGNESLWPGLNPCVKDMPGTSDGWQVL
ncbi:hypothetical protein HGRIS_013732 [Hohenbuehelia grisea]|uniref:Uncharacterized protein n=1 Tax=Hohenbuehelia grisea TaxID=104357 RepID=A0ABR3IWA2_9AGAR